MCFDAAAEDLECLQHQIGMVLQVLSEPEASAVNLPRFTASFFARSLAHYKQFQELSDKTTAIEKTIADLVEHSPDMFLYACQDDIRGLLPFALGEQSAVEARLIFGFAVEPAESQPIDDAKKDEVSAQLPSITRRLIESKHQCASLITRAKAFKGAPGARCLGPVCRHTVVLSLGELNFGFAQAARQLHPEWHIKATAYETIDDVCEHAPRASSANKGLVELWKRGDAAENGVDATEPIPFMDIYDAVFFNFPYIIAGRDSPQRTCLLIKEFLENCRVHCKVGANVVLGLATRKDNTKKYYPYGDDAEDIVAKHVGVLQDRRALRLIAVKMQDAYTPYEKEGYTHLYTDASRNPGALWNHNDKSAFVFKVCEAPDAAAAGKIKGESLHVLERVLASLGESHRDRWSRTNAAAQADQRSPKRGAPGTSTEELPSPPTAKKPCHE